MSRYVFAACLTIVAFMIKVRGDDSTPTASVRGRIVAENSKPLPEMIVFLEATEPGRQFPAPTKRAVISQNGAQFSPSLLVVSVGQTVEFPNDESKPIEHNVFSQSPVKTFDLGLFRPPESKKVTFEKPGPVRLFCSIHRYMDGLIYVCPTPFFAKVDAEGNYAISGIPPGEYRIRTWQRKQRYTDKEAVVKLEIGGDVTTNMELTRK